MKRSDGRSIPRDVLEHYRFQSLELKKKGWKINKIAEAFGVRREAVSRWINNASRYGRDILKRKRAKGKEPKLDKENKKQITSWLKKSAMEFGFETPLWDCKRIQKIIKKDLNKKIAISSLWETLRKWNLTPQKPEKEALEKDIRKVKKWLKEEWPKIEEHRRRWQAMLYFLDESGVSLNPVVGRTWAKKGETPKVKVTGNRGGLCVTSAISPAGRMVFRIEKKTIKAPQHIEFLKQIMQQHKWRKIIVIEDNARPHISQEVKNFIEKNKNKIAIYHLPAYSPDLNPDEKVWKYLKNVKLKTHQARNKKEFTPLVNSKMKGIQKRPYLIKSFFMGTYVL